MLDPTQLTVAEGRETGIVPIALDRLILSALNVRRTERDADIAALAEDIAARGLKQNLVVIPAHFSTGETDSDWDGKFEVIAGGRRVQALQLLAASGRMDADHLVPCMIEEREEARETSLSENLHRVAMNPADEFDAFAAIVAQLERDGAPHDDAIAQCAKRFGVTVRHVEGRLRLASLAPEILEALRAGKLGLESAKAYAITTDHKLQVKVFSDREKKSWLSHDPKGVREELRHKTVALTDGRVAFIGLETYVEAGGRIEAEMFMGSEGEQRIVDGPLLDKLAKAKAEEQIPARAKADGFKEGLFATGSGYNTHWPKAPKGLEKRWDYGGTISRAEKKKSVAVYSIAHDGTLKFDGRFGPPPKRESYKPPSPEEIAAARRDQRVGEIAARLAVGSFAGSPFEDRAYWPTSRWIDPIGHERDGKVLVAVLVEVTTEQIEAQVAEAERRYDAELAEQEKAKATPGAADDDGSDGEFDDEDVDALEDETA